MPVVPCSNSLKGGISSRVSIVIVELFKDPRFVFLGVDKPSGNVHLVFIPLEMLVLNAVVGSLLP
jgi:hypothetical protein